MNCLSKGFLHSIKYVIYLSGNGQACFTLTEYIFVFCKLLQVKQILEFTELRVLFVDANNTKNFRSFIIIRVRIL